MLYVLKVAIKASERRDELMLFSIDHVVSIVTFDHVSGAHYAGFIVQS